MRFDVVDVLERHARYLPHKTALIDDRSFTYRELWWAAGELAREWQAAGLRPGDCVATTLSPSATYAAVIVGMRRAGLVVAPVNTRLTAPEIGRYLERLGPRAVVTDEHHLAVVEGAGVPHLVVVPSGDTWRAHLGTPRGLGGPGRPVGPDAAFVMGTGGSTGIPKGAVISSQAAWMWATCAAFSQQLRQSDVELFGSPFFHSTFLTGVLSPLVAGAAVRVIGHYNAERVVEAVVRDGGTRLAGAPTMLQRVLDVALADPEQWRGVRLVQFGSTKAPPGFVEVVRRALPHADLITGYGTTEFGPVTRIYTPEFLSGVDAGVGRPVPAADVVILDPATQQPVTASGVEGEIAVSCPWQMSGYVDAEEETRQTILPSGHVRSGDIGRIDEHGFLHFQGRYKEIIITGGENVFPLEVERVIADHPAVADVAVYGVDDETWGERVEAAIVPVAGTALALDQLQSFCRARLAAFKIPRRLVVHQELPLTSNMKVDRQRLSREGARRKA